MAGGVSRGLNTFDTSNPNNCHLQYTTHVLSRHAIEYNGWHRRRCAPHPFARRPRGSHGFRGTPITLSRYLGGSTRDTFTGRDPEYSCEASKFNISNLYMRTVMASILTRCNQFSSYVLRQMGRLKENIMDGFIFVSSVIPMISDRLRCVSRRLGPSYCLFEET